MKKLISLALVAMVMVTGKTFAQSSLLATLSHEGTISVFRGGTALKEAVAAATHGDNITLSSGRFDAVDIDKAVTLRGTGIEEDAVNGTQGSRIVGNFTISIPDDVAPSFSMEGIYNTEQISIRGTLNNPMFYKCSFLRIYASNSCRLNALTVIHCKITDSFSMTEQSTGRFINSYVNHLTNGAPSAGALELTNCFLLNCQDVKGSVFTNCFLDSEIPNYSMHITNMCNNCVSFGQAFAKLSQLTNTTLETKEEFRALFKADTFYELTDEAKGKYKGNDDTEVGLYGGNLPFSTHVMSPQITKCNVAAKTTADGKLSVEIEVKAAE